MFGSFLPVLSQHSYIFRWSILLSEFWILVKLSKTWVLSLHQNDMTCFRVKEFIWKIKISWLSVVFTYRALYQIFIHAIPSQGLADPYHRELIVHFTMTFVIICLQKVICDVKSELAIIDFEIQPIIAFNFLFLSLFWASLKWLYLWNCMLSFYVFLVWYSSEVEAYIGHENWVLVQTHFAWSHHIWHVTNPK